MKGQRKEQGKEGGMDEEREGKEGGRKEGKDRMEGGRIHILGTSTTHIIIVQYQLTYAQ